MKHRRHGINVQLTARPDGTPLWFFEALPGRTHDLTAAYTTRHHPSLSDPADPRPGRPRLPGRRRHGPQPLLPPPDPTGPTTSNTTGNTPDSEPPGERAFAQLKQWHILGRARCSPNRIAGSRNRSNLADLQLPRMKRVHCGRSTGKVGWSCSHGQAAVSGCRGST
ncbi:hypothetical protein ABZ070_31185 [Streptomyces sp. NPDC006283]|uniref:hypothetical protein n=1 Tax=Streptomyces sp. NPDC006283 TaxID=3156741 RepID=UPI0033BCC3A3